MDGRAIQSPFTGEATGQRRTHNRDDAHQRTQGRPGHGPQQAAEAIQILGAGGRQQSAGVQEEQALENPVIEQVKQAAVQGQRGHSGQRRGEQ
jgi:hypothetical protein